MGVGAVQQEEGRERDTPPYQFPTLPVRVDPTCVFDRALSGAARERALGILSDADQS